MERIFDLSLQRFTANNQLNFIGATIKYFEKINEQWNESTKNTYFNIYQNKIFKIIDTNKPVAEYDDDYLLAVINNIIAKYNPQGDSISTVYRHLLVDPCMYYFNEYNPKHNPFWGTSYRTNYKENDESINNHLIKKSFTEDENKRAFNHLITKYNSSNGEDVGLAIMYLIGARINEVCGANFGDVHEMQDYPGVFYITIGYATTRLHSNKLKVGGKTINSPRRLPLTPAAVAFINARRKYVEDNVTFPITNEYGEVINSINDMPISCRKNSFASRSKSDDLTVYGRMFFKDALKIRESDISDLSLEVESVDIEEADATTYLFRRNFATHLYICGLDKTERKYYMGHSLEDSFTIRKDFNNEDLLYNMYVKLLKYELLNNSTISKTPEK